MPVAPVAFDYVAFDYVHWTELVGAAATCALAVPVDVAAMRRRDARPVVLLRCLQNGSVNDYAAELAVGILICVGTLSIGVLH